MTYNTQQPANLVPTPSLPINRAVESLQVRQIMATAPVTVSPGTSLHEAQTLMQQHHLPYLPVVENGMLVGMLDARDVQTYVPSPATSLSKWELLYLLDKISVREVMTTKVVTVAPETPVSEVIHLMLMHRVGTLPVVEAGQFVGLLSQADILQAFLLFQPTESLAV